MRVNISRTGDREVNIKVSAEPVCHIQSHGAVTREVLEQIVQSTCAAKVVEHDPKKPKYQLEGWMGHGLCYSHRNDPHTCDICGKPTKSRPEKTVGWMDLGRPDGDHRRYAHAECLEEVHDKPHRWPTGTVYRQIISSEERVKQWDAINRMKSRGMSTQDAWRLCMWRDGKPSPNIQKEFEPLYTPEEKDVVKYLGDLYVVTRVVTRVGGVAYSMITLSPLRSTSRSLTTLWAGKVELIARGTTVMRPGIKYAT